MNAPDWFCQDPFIVCERIQAHLFSTLPDADADVTAEYLVEVLPEEWCDLYRRLNPEPSNIYEFFVDDQKRFKYLFDLSTELVQQGGQLSENAVTDRVVAVYGRSYAHTEKRDASRMRGFLGGPLIAEGSRFDKGHFIGHAMGGGLDVNLFPQRPEVNRGWSERGKVYRAMERYCAKHPGTFCFFRPIYCDRSWHPCLIEYGVLKQDGELWVEVFDNCIHPDHTLERRTYPKNRP